MGWRILFILNYILNDIIGKFLVYYIFVPQTAVFKNRFQTIFKTLYHMILDQHLNLAHQRPKPTRKLKKILNWIIFFKLCAMHLNFDTNFFMTSSIFLKFLKNLQHSQIYMLKIFSLFDIVFCLLIYGTVCICFY